jgi:hypothetical protein
MDAVRYHDRNDGAVAGRSRSKLDAAARGAAPLEAPPAGAR